MASVTRTERFVYVRQLIMVASRIPTGRGVLDFSGFAEDDGQLQEKLNARKLTMLEVKVEEIWEKVRDLEIRNGRLEQENNSLRKELEN